MLGRGRGRVNESRAVIRDAQWLARFALFLQTRLGGVVALAIDRWDFGAHGPQVSGKLSSMVDGVVHCDLYKRSGGKLEDAAEIDHPGQCLAAERFELR